MDKHQHQIKAVFLDIDGTLVHQGLLLDSAKYAVNELLKTPTHVALCTGRSILHTLHIQKKLGIQNATYFNGGLAIKSDDTVLSLPLNVETVERVTEFSQKYRMPIILHTATRTIIFEELPTFCEPILEEWAFPPLELVSRNSWDATVEPVYQFNVFADRTWDQRIQSEFPECLLYRWHPQAMDLQKRDCDKKHGAFALLRSWGLTAEEAVHFGDGGNDIGMFQSMGVSMAMENASDDVKRHATYVTDAVYNDGVLKGLQKLGLIPTP